MGKKRFTDITLYDKEWFQILDLKYKLFWEYLLKRCNHAGIWDVNFRLAEFQIGATFNRKETLMTFDGRITEIELDKWIINKFIAFQYGSELNPANRVHGSVIALLEKHRLEMDGGVPRLKDSGKKGGKKTAKKVPKSGKKRFKAPSIEDVVQCFTDKGHPHPKIEGARFWNYYESKGWVVGKNPMKNWQAAVAGWMSRSKPNSNKKTYKQDGHGDKLSW